MKQTTKIKLIDNPNNYFLTPDHAMDFVGFYPLPVNQLGYKIVARERQQVGKRFLSFLLKSQLVEIIKKENVRGRDNQLKRLHELLSSDNVGIQSEINHFINTIHAPLNHWTLVEERDRWGRKEWVRRESTNS